MAEHKLQFDCHLPNLLHELVEGNPSAGPLITALNLTFPILRALTTRAAEIDDPQLNILMLRLNMYEVAPEDRLPAIDAQIARQKGQSVDL